MPEMRLCMALGQRLEQRQTLELKQQLVLLQLQHLGTESDKDAAAGVELLAIIMKDLQNDIYTDVENFVERVGKRVPKAKRTLSTREIVNDLRGLIRALNPTSLADIKLFVEYGLKTHECFGVNPAFEYTQLMQIMNSHCAEHSAIRGAVWALAAANVTAENPATNLVPRIEFVSSLDKVSSLAFSLLLQEFAVATTQVRDTLIEEIEFISCSEIAIIDEPIMEATLALLREFAQLLGHVRLGSSVSRHLARVICNSAMIPKTTHLPHLAFAFLENVSDEVVALLCEHFKEEPLVTGIDAQRAVLYALYCAHLQPCGMDHLAHMLCVSENAKMFVRVTRAYALAAAASLQLKYPSETKTAPELIMALEHGSLSTVFKHLNLTETEREKFLQLLMQPRNLRERAGFAQIVTRLTEIYSAHAPQVLSTLSEIVRANLRGEFNLWRYSNNASITQLRVLNDQARVVWQTNIVETHVLGAHSNIEARLNALPLLAHDAAVIFEMLYRTKWHTKLGSDLELKIHEVEKDLRDPSTSIERRKGLGAEVKFLRNTYRAARLIELFHCQVSEIDFARSYWKQVYGEPWVEPFREILDSAFAVLESPDLKDLRTIIFAETDYIVDLLDVGTHPVQSCQRWTESTGHNKCLLAYVGDGNKKVWQARTRGGETIGRAIVRLLPFKRTMLLLIEPPYARVWTSDHARALFTALLRKAARVAEALAKPIAVGYVGAPRYSEWGSAFDGVCKEFDIEPHTCIYKSKLPESVNAFEYSDSLGGSLTSGQSIAAKDLTYIMVGGDDE